MVTFDQAPIVGVVVAVMMAMTIMMMNTTTATRRGSITVKCCYLQKFEVQRKIVKHPIL